MLINIVTFYLHKYSISSLFRKEENKFSLLIFDLHWMEGLKEEYHYDDYGKFLEV